MALENLVKKPRVIDNEGLAIALRMQTIRTQLGFRQDEMAFFFKVSRETYWRWERYGPPRSPVVRQFCKMMTAKLSQKHRDKTYWRRHLMRRRKQVAANTRAYRARLARIERAAGRE